VAKLAETAQHHPDWHNSWNTVEIWLISHDADDSITDKDHIPAQEIDSVV
jgi:4a-hydroxytetrahydrobiopterin dehydratase